LSAIPPTAAPIADNSVTYAKIQDVSAAARLLGRGGAAGPGDPQELAVGAGLDLSANVLSAIPPTLADNAVTYAKIQDVSAASRLLGRGSAGGPGDPQELTLGAGLALTGQVLSATPPAAPTEYTAKLTNTTAITVPASVLTVLNFNTEVYDAANMRDPTFPSALISRATGKYLVTASVQSPGAASGYFQLRCTKNRAAAGEVVVASQTQANTALAFDCGLSVMLELLVGDFVELLVVHTGPASINLAVLAQTPIFCIAKVF
jgi:hypothetical protein